MFVVQEWTRSGAGVVLPAKSSKTLPDQPRLQMSAWKSLAWNVFMRIVECMKVHVSAPTEMLFLCVKWLISHIQVIPKSSNISFTRGPCQQQNRSLQQNEQQQHVLHVNKSLEVKPELCRNRTVPTTKYPPLNPGQVKVTESIRSNETKKAHWAERGVPCGGRYTVSHTVCVCVSRMEPWIMGFV